MFTNIDNEYTQCSESTITHYIYKKKYQKTHISSEAEKLPDKYKDIWDWNKSIIETWIPC